MLLHLNKTLFPVKESFHAASRFQRSVCKMYDPSAFFPDIEHLCLSEPACIRILSAALGEESSPVKFNLIHSSICRTAGNNFRLKFRKMTVFIKQFFCHFCPTSFPELQIPEDRYRSQAHVLPDQEVRYNPPSSAHLPQTGSLFHGRIY